MQNIFLTFVLIACFTTLAAPASECEFIKDLPVTIYPASEQKEQGWPFKIHDLMARTSPDAKFHLTYDSFGRSNLMQKDRVILAELSLGAEGYSFSDDGNYFFYTESGINHDSTVLRRFNLRTLQYAQNLKLPRSRRFLRAMNETTYFMQRIDNFSLRLPGDLYFAHERHGYGDIELVQIEKTFFGYKSRVTTLFSEFRLRDPRARQLVKVSPDLRHAVIVSTYYARWDTRVWPLYHFEVYRLDSGKKIAGSGQLNAYDWQLHTTISGLDTVEFLGDQLIMGGFQRSTAYTIYHFKTKQIELVDSALLRERSLPVIEVQNNILEVTMDPKNQPSNIIRARLEGFNQWHWGLQEQFHYFFMNNGQVLVLSHKANFLAAIDLTSGQLLDYEKLRELPGSAGTLPYLLNLRSRRYN